jgi:hypothetical protein
MGPLSDFIGNWQSPESRLQSWELRPASAPRSALASHFHEVPSVSNSHHDAQGFECPYDAADARGIHLRHIRKIEQNLAASFVNQLSKVVI